MYDATKGETYHYLAFQLRLFAFIIVLLITLIYYLVYLLKVNTWSAIIPAAALFEFYIWTLIKSPNVASAYQDHHDLEDTYD